MDEPNSRLNRISWWIVVPLVIAVISGIIVVEYERRQPPAVEDTPSPNEFNYVVHLMSEQDESSIARAKLNLEIDDQVFPKETDLEGQATFQLRNFYEGKLGELHIEIAGEYVGFIEVEIREELSPNEISIDLGSPVPEINTPTPTATAVNTATATPAPPTPTSSATQTAAAVSTATTAATATTTPKPEATATPTVASNLLIVVVPRGTAVNVYTRPSSETGSPRAQVVQNDLLTILETEGDWYRVQILKNGLEGWVENNPNNVQPFDGTPPPTAVPNTPTGNGSGCLSVTISRNDISDDLFDDVTLNWGNPPPGTARLRLEVRGVNSSGQEALVVQPTFSDLNSPYTVQQWMFESGDFTFNSTYTYYVSVLDDSGGLICQTSGTFTQ